MAEEGVCGTEEDKKDTDIGDMYAVKRANR